MEFLTRIQTFTMQNPTFAKYSMLGASASVIALLCVYGIVLAVYRLYFSPLAGFPGPKIAAATWWYGFYYDVWVRGQYLYKIEEMHKKYGKYPR
jgi:hypothetical protein